MWRALTDPADRAEWWHDVDLDVAVGGKLEERWSDDTGTPMLTTGHVLAVEAPARLRFAWADEGWPAATAVEISLREVDGQTVVRITETGWHLLPHGDTLAADHRAGWRAHLTNLRRHLEQ